MSTDENVFNPENVVQEMYKKTDEVTLGKSVPKYKIVKKWRKRNRPERIADMIDTDRFDELVKKGIPADVLLEAGPKALHRMGVIVGGWRASFTKPSLESRKIRNRRKNKNT